MENEQIYSKINELKIRKNPEKKICTICGTLNSIIENKNCQKCYAPIL